MPKRAFYPATLILFGLIEMANMLGYLPLMLRDIWPVLMIIVGLGGILTADREDWMSTARTPKPAASKRSRR